MGKKKLTVHPLLRRPNCSTNNSHENKDFVTQTNKQKHPNIGQIEVTNSAVEKLLSNLNASKAVDPNELSLKLLKTTWCESAHILQAIFQLSLDTGELPADWKKALLTPVFKNASRNIPANYRTVSLTQFLNPWSVT